ncbi:hypothetical protein BN903_12 [Halorubrum sp. AJ67]|nr:hypothetical protein BN903_12 [Halorubrum sp. AJ67]
MSDMSYSRPFDRYENNIVLQTHYSRILYGDIYAPSRSRAP